MMGPIKGVSRLLQLISHRQIARQFSQTCKTNFHCKNCEFLFVKNSLLIKTTCCARDTSDRTLSSFSDNNKIKKNNQSYLSLLKLYKEFKRKKIIVQNLGLKIINMKDKFSPINPEPVTQNRSFSLFSQLRKKNESTSQR